MAAIRLENVGKTFDDGTVAVADLSLSIADGERMALVGPSGSGKSTVLRLIAGLETPTSGRIRIGERDVTDLPPEARDLAMVFQSYALYPHKSVRQNLAFGLEMRRVPPDEIRSRVDDVAGALGLAPLLDRMPGALSGGQRQRVALGRAIARKPQAFLFDEPLSNLDPRLRGETRTELVDLHRRLGATMIYVTHDQEEAMTLGQRVAVLRDGRLEQVGRPLELYHRPANVFVAGFIGSPPMNLLAAATAEILAGGVGVAAPPAGGHLGVRPWDLAVITTGAEAPLSGTVELIEPLGHAVVVHLSLEGGVRLTSVAPPGTVVHVGDRVGMTTTPDCVHVFDAMGRRRSDP